MSTPERPFPPGFVWGAATAAFQVEGGPDVDGKGPSIWDTFTRSPGAIASGATADVACDHHRRYPEDITLLAELGLSAYRFSISWPRVQPYGTGPAERRGLDHYRRMVDACLERGVTPFVTLYHWDLPQALEDRGGWRARETAHRFAEYTALVGDALGDVVHHWITVNEPKVAAHAGYAAGIHAPGVHDPLGGVRAGHHLLLAHGLAVPVLRERTTSDAQIGISLDLTPVTPASASAEDVAAARRFDGNFNRMYLEPVLRGTYPADMLEWFGGAPWLLDGDLDIISVPTDFLGINYYRGHVIASAEKGLTTGSPMELDAVHLIRDLLVQLRDQYPGVPLLITENGAAYPDVPGPDGFVDDPERVAYFASHLRQALDAIDHGVDLRGYFAWTLLDNFEWAEGYGPRFGLVRVDFDTQRRTAKRSGRWLGSVARANALPGDYA
jgi:beta-glucosidase